MLNDDVIALNLRTRTAHTAAPVAEPPKARTDDDLGLDALAEAIQALRSGAVASVARPVAERLGDRSAAALKQSIQAIERQRKQQRDELSALVAVVREAVSSLTTESDSLQTTLSESTDRFAALAQLTDPARIKAQLVTEVTALKRIAEQRHKAWNERAASFTARVETLEQQLVSSQKEASVDPLTGIANRRSFDRTCRQWFQSGGFRQILALFDVDDFKKVNDVHGHGAGDKVLCGIAQALQQAFRSGDVIARLGGDEFAVLASNLTLAQAESRLATIVSGIGRKAIDVGGATITPGVSCGVVEFSSGDTVESLMARADEALYAAKRLGKNRVASRARPLLRDLMKR